MDKKGKEFRDSPYQGKGAKGGFTASKPNRQGFGSAPMKKGGGGKRKC